MLAIRLSAVNTEPRAFLTPPPTHTSCGLRRDPEHPKMQRGFSAASQQRQKDAELTDITLPPTPR